MKKIYAVYLLRVSKFQPTREWVNKVNLSSFQLKNYEERKRVRKFGYPCIREILLVTCLYVRSSAPKGIQLMWNDLFYFVWGLQPAFNLMINVHAMVILATWTFRQKKQQQSQVFFRLQFKNECRQGLSKIGNGQAKPSLILCV